MQLASLARRTGRPSAACRSAPKLRPFSQTELALRIRPVRGEIEPGMPMPMLAQEPASPSTSATRPATHMIAAS